MWLTYKSKDVGNVGLDLSCNPSSGLWVCASDVSKKEGVAEIMGLLGWKSDKRGTGGGFVCSMLCRWWVPKSRNSGFLSSKPGLGRGLGVGLGLEGEPLCPLWWLATSSGPGVGRGCGESISARSGASTGLGGPPVPGFSSASVSLAVVDSTLMSSSSLPSSDWSSRVWTWATSVSLLLASGWDLAASDDVSNLTAMALSVSTSESSWCLPCSGLSLSLSGSPASCSPSFPGWLWNRSLFLHLALRFWNHTWK